MVFSFFEGLSNSKCCTRATWFTFLVQKINVSLVYLYNFFYFTQNQVFRSFFADLLRVISTRNSSIAWVSLYFSWVGSISYSALSKIFWNLGSSTSTLNPSFFFLKSKYSSTSSSCRDFLSFLDYFFFPHRHKVIFLFLYINIVFFRKLEKIDFHHLT